MTGTDGCRLSTVRKPPTESRPRRTAGDVRYPFHPNWRYRGAKAVAGASRQRSAQTPSTGAAPSVTADAMAAGLIGVSSQENRKSIDDTRARKCAKTSR